MTGAVHQYHHINTLNAPQAIRHPGLSPTSPTLPSLEDLKQAAEERTHIVSADFAVENPGGYAADLGVLVGPSLSFAELRLYYLLTVHGHHPLPLADLCTEDRLSAIWMPDWLVAIQEDTLHDPLDAKDRADFDAIGAYGDYLVVHGIPR